MAYEIVLFTRQLNKSNDFNLNKNNESIIIYWYGQSSTNPRQYAYKTIE